MSHEPAPPSRPRSFRTHHSHVPIGIEKVLCRAAQDPAFKAELFADRRAALVRAGYTLKSGELAVLNAVSDAQLEIMIGRIDAKAHRRSKVMRTVQTVLLAAATTATVATTEGCTGEDSSWPEDQWEQKDQAEDPAPDPGQDADQSESAEDEQEDKAEQEDEHEN